MKRLITIIVVSMLLQSCGPTITPLIRDYSKVHNTFYTDMPKDEVWGKIVELFSTNGIGISLIDKSSGLIISNKTDFITTTTTEMPNGDLVDNKAYIVRERKDMGLGEVRPFSVNGTWNIRVFEKDGKSGVNINLTNIYAGITSHAGYQSFELTFNAKSTGNFERMIMDSITF